MDLMDQFLRERGKGNVDSFRSMVADLAAQVTAVPRERGAYGLIHGDLHNRNFRVTESGALTLFDFDHGGYGWRAYDLATCRGPLSDEAWCAFLDGYQSVRSLSDAELEIIPTFQKIRPIWDLGDVLAMRSAWGPGDEFGDRFADDILVTLARVSGT